MVPSSACPRMVKSVPAPLLKLTLLPVQRTYCWVVGFGGVTSSGTLTSGVLISGVEFIELSTMTSELAELFACEFSFSEELGALLQPTAAVAIAQQARNVAKDFLIL